MGFKQRRRGQQTCLRDIDDGGGWVQEGSGACASCEVLPVSELLHIPWCHLFTQRASKYG
jgi:hypothetical protein